MKTLHFQDLVFYRREFFAKNLFVKMAEVTGLEPITRSFGDCCSTN